VQLLLLLPHSWRARFTRTLTRTGTEHGQVGGGNEKEKGKNVVRERESERERERREGEREREGREGG